MTKYYVYPDGTITDEPLSFKATTPLVPSFMSDDYYVLEAWDYEEAYEQAYLLGLI